MSRDRKAESMFRRSIGQIPGQGRAPTMRAGRHTNTGPMKPTPDSAEERIASDQQPERTMRQCVFDFLMVLFAVGVFPGALYFRSLHVE